MLGSVFQDCVVQLGSRNAASEQLNTAKPRGTASLGAQSLCSQPSLGLGSCSPAHTARPTPHARSVIGRAGVQMLWRPGDGILHRLCQARPKVLSRTGSLRTQGVALYHDSELHRHVLEGRPTVKGT